MDFVTNDSDKTLSIRSICINNGHREHIFFATKDKVFFLEVVSLGGNLIEFIDHGLTYDPDPVKNWNCSNELEHRGPVES